MKLIQETDYAFRIMYALYSHDGMLSAGQISEQMNITEGFTKKILNKLIKSKLIKSRRGIDGGYVTERPPSGVSLFDIICAIEGDVYINRCLLHENECTRPIDKAECVMHCELQRVNKIINDELKRTNFDQLLKKQS